MNLKISWCFYFYFVNYDSALGFPWPCTSFIPDNLPNTGLFVGSDTKIILSNLKRVRSSPFARVSLSVFNLVNTDPSVKLQKSTQPSSISKFQQFLNKKKTRKVSETEDRNTWLTGQLGSIGLSMPRGDRTAWTTLDMKSHHFSDSYYGLISTWTTLNMRSSHFYWIFHSEISTWTTLDMKSHHF